MKNRFIKFKLRLLLYNFEIFIDVSKTWKKLVQHPDTTYSMVKLTQYHIPEAKAFNLLGSDENSTETKDSIDVTQSSNKGKRSIILRLSEL